MRIIFAGTPEVAVPALMALLHSVHEVVAVLTRPDAPVGRKRVLTPSPVKRAALEHELTVYETSRIDDAVTTRLRALNADAGVVVAYGALLKPPALAVPRLGWFNLHFSLLPHYRGPAPVQRAMMDGQHQTGLSVFQLDEGMDTGPIVVQREVRLDHASAGEALHDFSYQGTDLILEALDKANAGVALTPQPIAGTHAAKITPADAKLDFSATSAEVLAIARGVTPAPGAWATMAGKRTKLAGLHPGFEAGDTAPGSLSESAGKVYIGTADGAVQVDQIQPFGKPMMDARAFMRGRPHAHFDIPSSDE